MKIENRVKIQKLNVEKGRRMLVTSDIHGHLGHLKTVLDKARFSEDDILIIVGDIIEKGPESLNTLRYVMELSERDNVIVLPGNVDVSRLRWINKICEEKLERFYRELLKTKEWFGHGFVDELAGELGYAIDSPGDLCRVKEDILAHFEREFLFILNLPTVLETQNFIFVHGGLRDEKLADNEKREAFDLIKYDNFMNSTPLHFEKYVVAGHWPVNNYEGSVLRLNPIINQEKRIIAIDGGCGIKRYGQLNLLIIPEVDCGPEEIDYISYDTLPVCTALTRQEEVLPELIINYGRDEIQVLESDGDCIRVFHPESGRTFWIPEGYFWKDSQDTVHCYDYSDHLLGIQPGERISLIKKTSRGSIVKKDGIIGLYYGEMEQAGVRF